MAGSDQRYRVEVTPAAARQLFAQSEPPDGVFCVTDLLAMGFMDTARHEFGVSVPEDLCIVGFDDIDQADWTSYSLTTFRQPLELVAERIAELLQSDGPPLEGPVSVQPALVWRRSVRPKTRGRANSGKGKTSGGTTPTPRMATTRAAERVTTSG